MRVKPRRREEGRALPAPAGACIHSLPSRGPDGSSPRSPRRRHRRRLPVFIYPIEENPQLLPAARSLFERADRGELEIVTSAITLLEVLVAPYRAGDAALAARYEAILTSSRGIRLVEIDQVQLRTAAQLRALYGPRAPDALQLAAALTTRCSALVTNDRRFPTLPGLSVVQLSDIA